LVRLPEGFLKADLKVGLYDRTLLVVFARVVLGHVGVGILGRVCVGGVLCFLGLGGDIVEIDGLAIVQIINGIDSTVRPLLDRTLGLVFLLRGLLTAAQSLWRRGRSEVGRAIAAAARTAEAAATAATTKATAAWTRTPEAAATGARSAKATAAGTRASEPSTRWTKARRAIFSRARFAHRQVASLERLRVEFVDDLLGDRALGKFDECESARTSGFAIDRHDDMSGLRNGREVGSKIRFRRAVWEVPYEQTDSHYASVKPVGFYLRVAANAEYGVSILRSKVSSSGTPRAMSCSIETRPAPPTSSNSLRAASALSAYAIRA
jgi:hypothetical protein